MFMNPEVAVNIFDALIDKYASEWDNQATKLKYTFTYAAIVIYRFTLEARIFLWNWKWLESA